MYFYELCVYIKFLGFRFNDLFNFKLVLKLFIASFKSLDPIWSSLVEIKLLYLYLLHRLRYLHEIGKYDKQITIISRIRYILKVCYIIIERSLCLFKVTVSRKHSHAIEIIIVLLSLDFQNLLKLLTLPGLTNLN